MCAALPLSCTHVLAGFLAAFRYSSKMTPRRLLTKPAEPASNSGWDNCNHDLIVAVGDEFVSTQGSRWAAGAAVSNQPLVASLACWVLCSSMHAD